MNIEDSQIQFATMMGITLVLLLAVCALFWIAILWWNVKSLFVFGLMSTLITNEINAQSKAKKQENEFNKYQIDKNEQIASQGADYFRNKAQANQNRHHPSREPV